MKFASALLLILILGAWGCATTESLRAYDGVSSVYPQAIREISWQTARAMADRYPAGQTTLQLVTLPDSSFSKQFESDLRALGFSVSSDPDMIGIDILQVGYVLDVLPEGRTCYLDLRVSDGNRLARTYKVTATGVIAGGGTATSNWPAPLPSSPRESSATIRNALDSLPPAGGIHERTLTDDSSAPASSTPPAPASYVAPSQPQVVTTTPEPSAPAPIELQKTPQTPTPPPVAVSSPASAAEAPTSSSASVSPATPAAPAPEAPVPLLQEHDGTTQESWKIEPGPLQPQVEQWASRAGYQVVWKSPHDYEMQSNCVFREDFIGAIKQLFRSMQQSGNALHVALYQANHVLVVTED